MTFSSAVQSSCDTSYIEDCISSGVLSICGALSETACACGSSGQAAIGTIVGSCLISRCPLGEILSLASLATTACDAWVSTHTLVASGPGQAPNTSTAFAPSSTAFSSTMASVGQMSITSFPTVPTSPVTATGTNTNTTSPSPSVGAEVGIVVGALALLGMIVFLFVLCLRRRRSKRSSSLSSASAGLHELHTGSNVHELPDKTRELQLANVAEIPLQDLTGFQFPFQSRPDAPVEADSRSGRAGHPQGRQAGTEATFFDFESQKVLLTPDMRENSTVSGSTAGSLRRHSPEA